MGKFIKAVVLFAIVIGFNAGTAYAALITGGMGITGNYNADATILTLNSATGTTGSGGIGNTVGSFTPGSIIDGVIDYAAFTGHANLLEIGGWTLGLSTLDIDNPDVNLLHLSGTGVLSGNGFDATDVTWTFSAQSAASYSLAVTAVPIPAAVWLFGSGLLGLVGIARRKA